MVTLLEQEQVLPISREEAWAFFADPRNLDRITPEGMGFETVSGADEMVHEGQLIVHRVGVLPGIKIPWVTEISAVKEGVSFVDEQQSGPFKFWRHHHELVEVEGGVLVRDRLEYEVGWWIFGKIAEKLFVGRKIRWVFGARQRILAGLFAGS